MGGGGKREKQTVIDRSREIERQCVYVCVCVCVCMRVCVRARARACVCVCVLDYFTILQSYFTHQRQINVERDIQ